MDNLFVIRQYILLYITLFAPIIMWYGLYYIDYIFVKKYKQLTFSKLNTPTYYEYLLLRTGSEFATRLINGFPFLGSLFIMYQLVYKFGISPNGFSTIFLLSLFHWVFHSILGVTEEYLELHIKVYNPINIGSLIRDILTFVFFVRIVYFLSDLGVTELVSTFRNKRYLSFTGVLLATCLCLGVFLYSIVIAYLDFIALGV